MGVHQTAATCFHLRAVQYPKPSPRASVARGTGEPCDIESLGRIAGPTAGVARSFCASPSANPVGTRKNGRTTVSARDAEPYGPILTERDLASEQLWYRSLARSRQRRRLAEDTRRRAPRRKGAALTVTAAMVVGPAAPTLAGAASGNERGTAGQTTPPDPVLLHFGVTGNGVAALQKPLNRIVPHTRLEVARRCGQRTQTA